MSRDVGRDLSSCRVVQELVMAALQKIQAAETEALMLPTHVDRDATEHITAELARATGLRGAFYTLSALERSMKGEL